MRLIGGRWRGRRLPVPDAPGLRPSADRLRETLFNWLQPDLAGARCLDLFAGSGALGFEAVSRGAAEVVLVESAGNVFSGLRGSLARLEGDGNGRSGVTGAASAAAVHLVNERAEVFLANNHRTFDIVFVDPPFDRDLQRPILQVLAEEGHLASEALVHVEAPAERSFECIVPAEAGYRLHRERRFGDVAARLLVR